MPKDKLQKCEVSSKDEIGELVTAFNELIDRVAELEEKRRAFVSDASHELKTPLSIIKLLSDSLIQTENPDPQFLREFLTDMNEEVERLTRIIQRLLDLTKMDQSHTNMNVEVVSVTALAGEVCEKLKPLAENKQINFIYTRPDDDLMMPIDRDSMTEAIYNIADNSIKYTENGGTVKLELLRDLGNILIRISDSGIGIPKEEIQKIFDRFYRVDKARARDTGGTGLGLSIAMDAVKLHGGYIEVSSEEEKGSTFTIVLPFESGTPAAPEDALIQESVTDGGGDGHA
nr:HAMP domain-containing sensor histidine kinase [Congzhengia minquanensis]